jgi:hypothetical protein
MRNAVTAHAFFSEQTKESVMAHASNKQLQRIPAAQQREASNFTIAVVMAGIFAFFIAGIASAFIYAKDTNPAQVASTPTPPATGTPNNAPPETTGSGAK